MKKLLAAVLVMLVFSCTAVAEGETAQHVDFTSFDDAESEFVALYPNGTLVQFTGMVVETFYEVDHGEITSTIVLMPDGLTDTDGTSFVIDVRPEDWTEHGLYETGDRIHVEGIVNVDDDQVIICNAVTKYPGFTPSPPSQNATPVPENTEPGRKVTISFAGLLARGYSMSDAEELMDKWKRGEPLTPFQVPEYDEYNSPAEDNGRGGDLLLLTGTVKEYVKTGNSSDYVIGIRLEQADGNEWMISCAQCVDKNLIGGVWDNSGNTVFDGLDGATVEIYGKYSGFSEKFKLPVVDIVAYGGLFVPDEGLFISTMTAKLLMQKDDIYALGSLIGAERYRESTEKYVYR